ncbi:MAG TPA: hypothetical protein VMT60_01905 [Candidatus Bathyarchaeia archaeon]|nr:hypothetical protein [Candidatus Bathyarchaeia archaeon]
MLTVIALAHSCASLGPPRLEAPCDERFEALVPTIRAAEGIEIVGKLRMEIAQYRVRGVLRIAYSPRERVTRLDFRHSSLFGAIEEDVTVLAGDSLSIYDRTRGRSWGNDSSLALVEEGMGERITSADILAALLIIVPTCAELGTPEIEYAGPRWHLKGLWRDRRIEMSGSRGAGISRFRECFAGGKRCYTMEYGRSSGGAKISYPSWVRLSRENGEGRATFELIEIKELNSSTSLFEMNGPEGR